ncbi:reverse transcriptase domain-containing protein [Tanacetum coccineum]
MSSSTPAVSSDVVELKDMVRALILDKKNQTPAPAPVKAIEQSCVTCGGGHSYQNGPTPMATLCDNKQEYGCHQAADLTTTREMPVLPDPQNGSQTKFDLPINQPLTFQAQTSVYQAPVPPAPELSLPALTKTRMILELADRTISTPTGIAEDVSLNWSDLLSCRFCVVDYIVRYSGSQILGRPFLRTHVPLIDVHGEQMTLRHDDQSVTFKVEVREISESGNPTSTSGLMIDSRNSIFSPPYGGSDFLMEEIDEFLEHDDSIPPGVDGIYDSEGDTVYLEELLSVINSDPNLPPSPVCEINVPEEIKSSCEDPPDLELKDLPSHLEYAFLEGDDKLPVIIAKNLKDEDKTALIKVLKSHKHAIAWKISDIKGIDPQFCTHKILMEENAKPVVQHQRRVNPKIHEVIKQEVIKLLDAGLVTGWRVCIDYRKLNDATRKDHFPLPFMDQMLERLARNEYYCFLDGFSGYFQIPIDPLDQEKTTFTCPYGTFAYRRMPFGLCNAPGTFQRCMVAIFHDMIEKTMEVFMDDFSVFVLGHKISKSGIEVDKAKVDVIAKLPHPTTVKALYNTDYSALMYLIAKQVLAKIVWWIFAAPRNVLSLFVIKKGAENLADDHLSGLEKSPSKLSREKGNYRLRILSRTLGWLPFVVMIMPHGSHFATNFHDGEIL